MALVAGLSGFRVQRQTPPVETRERDIVKRRRQSLESFSAEDGQLQKAHAYWQTKRRGGLLPGRNDIDIVDLRPLVGWMHLIDVSHDDPGEWKYRVSGTLVRFDPQRINPSNLRIRDFPSSIYRESLIEDYTAVKFTGVPAYHNVVALVNFRHYSYSRLILPMAADGRRVDTLLVCIHKHRFGDLAV